jgi:hypothetical protein
MPHRALASLLVLLVAAPAAAVPPPIELTRHRGRLTELKLPRVADRLPGPSMKPMAAVGATDVRAIRCDATLDPATGAVSVKVEIDLIAISPVGSFGLYLDDGLSVSSTTASGTTVSHTTQDYAPYRMVWMSFSPSIAAGAQKTIVVEYAGVLNCKTADGYSQCAVGTKMPFLLEGSVMPALVDAAGQGGYNVWGSTRSLTLRLPSGTDVIASGELAEQSDDGTTSVTRWETPGYQSIGGYLAVMGAFDQMPAAGTSIPTAVVSLKSAPTWSSEMAGWMQSILPFVDTQAGLILPYQKLNVIKLPSGAGFPGTAGHAITLLNEDYGVPGARYFEETLAHENAHQWWGVLVSPTDTVISRWLTEGLATMAQVDYTTLHRIPAPERDAYLARRYREHRVLVRHHTGYETFPPLVVSAPALAPQFQPDYTIWAYIRSAAVLEHLRVALGEQTFETALRDWAAQCMMKSCDTSDFRGLLEAASGEDLGAVFTALVYETHYPRPVFSFSQQPPEQGDGLSVEVSDEGIDTPLALVVQLESGGIEKHTIRLAPGVTHFDLPASGRVRSVRPNPRHDALIWSRPARSGDQDFDGEVDGLDLIQCALAHGRTADLVGYTGDGILGIDLAFDPRCDIDENGKIEDIDLEPTITAFGSLKQEGQ